MPPDFDAALDFLQRLIQTPSLPGQERDIARLVAAEMEGLGYDEVRTDEAGNVIGFIQGERTAPAVMFNTHLDHVDVGDHAAWPHPPFGGEIHEDAVWGRGAVDIKGPLAAQVYGVARLKEQGSRPPGDVYVTAVVQEEIGGTGARHLMQHLRPPLIVVGEPSRNEVRRGHRGRLELVLHVKGRSAHASAPSRGINPLAVVGRFIERVAGLEMKQDPDLGASSLALTLIRTDQTSANVIPGEVWLTIDWRNVPGETDEDARRKLQAVADQCLIEGATAEVEVPVFPRETYTGLRMDMPAANHPFVLRADDPALPAARAVLAEALGTEPPVAFWTFATDGGHFAKTDARIVGFGPGDEALAHTVREHLPLAQLAAALDGNEALARHWPARTAHGT